MTDEATVQGNHAIYLSGLTACWRALHVLVDPPPHLLDDRIGLQLADVDDGWRDRPDMDAEASAELRAAVLARARFAEDLVAEQAGRVGQYVILGAGLDTFAQRRPAGLTGLRIFEVDQPAAQEWKRRRLDELGYGVADWLSLIPVDFEAGASWITELFAAGFDPNEPAVVTSTGVSMYLSREANLSTLRQAASLAPGSTFAMTFQLTAELLDEKARAARLLAEQGVKALGTAFLSFFTPHELIDLAHEAGFTKADYVSAADLNERYFADRTDLRVRHGEGFLVATV